jgi:molybdate transport system substrate-binding protein
VRLPALLLFAIALLVASCSGDDGEEDDTGAADAGALSIFAASSLQGVFEELAPEADFRFGSSDELSRAIMDGDVPDVFAAAGQVPIAELQPEGILDPPVVFATNRLVLVVPAEGSAVESVDDLAEADFLLGAELDYARSTLEAIGQAGLVEGAAYDPGAAELVASGDAEAALVYFTDAQAVGDGVRVIELPAQALVEYPIAASNLSDAYEAAEAFVQLVLSDQGRQTLEDAGFGVPPAP